MTSLVVLILLTGAPVPPECEPPPLHDVTSLKTFTQKSGTLSVGLDSVATWCFDSGGAWTGGVRSDPGKKAKPVDPKAPAVGDCARALTSCEDAKAALTADLSQLLTDALADLERPFRGQKYPPKRSGLNERPSTSVNCQERSRPDLFAQAQARMDLARLASAAQNEYANYKTWLYARGLECGQQVRAGRVDNTRVAVAVDVPNAGAGGGGAAMVGIPTNGGGTAGTISGSASIAAGGGTAGAGAGATGPKISLGTPVAGGGTAGLGGGASGSKVSVGTLGAGGGTAAMGGGAAGAKASVGAPVVGGGTAIAGPGPKPTGTTLMGTAGGSAMVIATATLSTGPTSVSVTGTPTITNPSGTPPIGPAEPLLTPSIQGPDASVAAPKNELLETWRSLAAQRGKMELDRDYTLGFLASRELRDCRCQRSSPAGIVSRLESGEGTAQLESDNQRAVACEHCLQNAFAAWRARIQKQCSLMSELSQYELEVLQRSDDGNGLPPRCMIDAYGKRGLDAGVLVAAATPTKPPPSLNPTATTGGTTFTVPLDPKSLPPAPSPAPTGVPRFEPPSPLADGFFRPSEPAPIPLREDGRLYVRVFMSSTCAADVLPGPVLARTGDLLLIPYGARQLSLRSPCGGLAEVYWGREAAPRVSEVFGRNQPLHFQFKPQ